MKNGEKSEIFDEKRRVYRIQLSWGGFWLKRLEYRGGGGGGSGIDSGTLGIGGGSAKNSGGNKRNCDGGSGGADEVATGRGLRVHGLELGKGFRACQAR